MAGPKAVGDEPRQSYDIHEVGSDSEATVTSPLLGAGTADDYGSEDGAGAGVNGEEGGWEGYKDFEGLPWWRRPSVFWLLGPYIMFTLAFGGVMVPKLNLILSMICKRYFDDRAILDPNQPVTPVFLGGDNPQCNIPEVQSKVSTFILAMNLTTGLLSAIVAPKLGHLSDRYGRARLLAVASTGGLVGEIITVIAAKFPETVDYRWLVLGSVFDGATGSFTAGGILIQSYTSDCTPPSRRAVSIGYVHACLFTGLAFGPLLAGYFVKWTGSLLSIFYIIIGCHSVFIFIMALVIPESLSKAKRLVAQEKWAKEKKTREESMGTWLSSIQNINPFEPLRILWPGGPGTSTTLRLNLVALAICDVVILGSSIAAGAVIILYSEYTFGWGNLESSQFISALSLVRVVTLMGVFPLVNYIGRVLPARRRQARGEVVPDKNSGADSLDIWVTRVALLSDILGCVTYITARDDKVFFAGGMITAFGGLGGATTQAVVTKHVPQQKVGQIFGAIGMLHALARVIGPVVFNGIYAATVGTFPQAFFLVLGGLYGFALLSTAVLRPHVHWDADDSDDGEREPLNNSNRAAPTASDDDTIAVEEDQLIVR